MAPKKVPEPVEEDEIDEEYSKKFWREADEERKAAFKENPESFR